MFPLHIRLVACYLCRLDPQQSCSRRWVTTAIPENYCPQSTNRRNEKQNKTIDERRAGEKGTGEKGKSRGKRGNFFFFARDNRGRKILKENSYVERGSHTVTTSVGCPTSHLYSHRENSLLFVLFARSGCALHSSVDCLAIHTKRSRTFLLCMSYVNKCLYNTVYLDTRVYVRVHVRVHVCTCVCECAAHTNDPSPSKCRQIPWR